MWIILLLLIIVFFLFASKPQTKDIISQIKDIYYLKINFIWSTKIDNQWFDVITLTISKKIREVINNSYNHSGLTFKIENGYLFLNYSNFSTSINLNQLLSQKFKGQNVLTLLTQGYQINEENKVKLNIGIEK